MGAHHVGEASTFAQLGLLVAAADEKRNIILANILKEDN
jgi:hypothetical protein